MASKFAGILLLLATAVNAGIIPTVEVLQGPGSKTTLLGPDGSTLSAAAPGGTVVTNDGGIGLVAAAPAILPSGPEIVVAGPAGSIATINTLAGPAIVPAALAAAPAAVVASPAAVAAVSPAALLGDIESTDGAYVPDNTEQLYDDGSYKEEK
ncbi:uncharacterized protein LOC108904843 [Anoplophora glabripennis]|uniref:uncharacterized protein LOC108904843 n=1 Tax=Anoplophora glabripennis TaxID=217634 RepID=UPI0008752EEA|nr:uncharacterized protein LOC108904843 [Anoplophora glabripennis]